LGWGGGINRGGGYKSQKAGKGEGACPRYRRSKPADTEGGSGKIESANNQKTTRGKKLRIEKNRVRKCGKKTEDKPIPDSGPDEGNKGE